MNVKKHCPSRIQSAAAAAAACFVRSRIKDLIRLRLTGNASGSTAVANAVEKSNEVADNCELSDK